MKEFTMAEFGVFLGVIGGVLTSILMTLQKSRCKKLKCGCVACERDLKAKPPPGEDAGVLPPTGSTPSPAGA
tara:strand:- start:1014 stop:1229 length:216 start_codon:yes stop_codon:yes gene_type:complete